MNASSFPRQIILVAVAMGLILLSPARVEALFMEWEEIERPIDLRVAVAERQFGLAEEVHVKKWFLNSYDGREVKSVGTAIHLGFGAITVPCRLIPLVSMVGGCLVAVITTPLLLRVWRRWMNNRVCAESC